LGAAEISSQFLGGDGISVDRSNTIYMFTQNAKEPTLCIGEGFTEYIISRDSPWEIGPIENLGFALARKPPTICLPGAKSGMMRNFLINAAFSILQYGAGPWMPMEPAYTVDRWAANRGGMPGITITRKMADPGSGARYRMRICRDMGNASSQPIVFYQALDSERSKELAGKDITFSFSGFVGSSYSAPALISRITFGTGTDQAASGAPAARWAGAIYSDQSNSPTTVRAPFSHTASVPSNASQVGVSLMMQPVGIAGVDDCFYFEAPKLEVGNSSTPFEGQSDDAAFSEAAMFYEDLARDPFTGIKHLRVIAEGKANGNDRSIQELIALVHHKAKRNYDHTLTVGTSDSWHVTAAAGSSYWGLYNPRWSHQTVGGSLLQFQYGIGGPNVALPDGYPVYLALDGGAKSSKFAISSELAP
jgi:hypothetical protein